MKKSFVGVLATVGASAVSADVTLDRSGAADTFWGLGECFFRFRILQKVPVSLGPPLGLCSQTATQLHFPSSPTWQWPF